MEYKGTEMKIALVCSSGGHLTEMQFLLEAFEGHEIFFVTYDNARTRKLPFKKYLMENIGTNPIKMAVATFIFIKIFIKEKPGLIVSTGSEIAIPAFYLGKLFRMKTLYIESWCRITSQSGTGKLVYPVSDIFLVQWPQLLHHYGPKAQYFGGVI
jgi:beta-1,4-N-acetylglucosaminyltransferase